MFLSVCLQVSERFKLVIALNHKNVLELSEIKKKSGDFFNERNTKRRQRLISLATLYFTHFFQEKRTCLKLITRFWVWFFIGSSLTEQCFAAKRNWDFLNVSWAELFENCLTVKTTAEKTFEITRSPINSADDSSNKKITIQQKCSRSARRQPEN